MKQHLGTAVQQLDFIDVLSHLKKLMQLYCRRTLNFIKSSLCSSSQTRKIMHHVKINDNTQMTSIRWAFNFREWQPTEDEWMFAAQCIQPEEKDRIEKFVFQKDAKASMIGQLLIRKFIHSSCHIPFSEIKTQRDDRNKPFFHDNRVDFNVSHHGKYTVIVGEISTDVKVGVDIMQFEKRSGDLNEFFRLMSRTFATEEWETINSSCVDKDRLAMFHRHWCLKESYVKAIGVGITMDLRRIRFSIKTRRLSRTKACFDTELFVDGRHQSDWRFEEWLLDDEHCVAVALSGNITAEPVPFKLLNWEELSRGIQPIIPADTESAHKFILKDESPSRGMD